MESLLLPTISSSANIHSLLVGLLPILVTKKTISNTVILNQYFKKFSRKRIKPYCWIIILIVWLTKISIRRVFLSRDLYLSHRKLYYDAYYYAVVVTYRAMADDLFWPSMDVTTPCDTHTSGGRSTWVEKKPFKT